jgi:LPXTG-site transpeptidase (sortase) family protein
LLNPLFAPSDDTDESQAQDERYILQHRHAGALQPVDKELRAPSSVTHIPPAPTQPHNPAVELIRKKVAAMYSEEPTAAQELAAPTPPEPQRSPHQQFMHELSTSGKSLAHIQTEWHNYYVQLSNSEKHAVWREFYAANARSGSRYTQFTQQASPAARYTPTPVALPAYPSPSKAVVAHHMAPPQPVEAPVSPQKFKSPPSLHALRKRILDRVAASEKTQTKVAQHFQSLLFGLGTGSIVLVIFLFGFFNEMLIAPFIQPSRHVSATPIIMNADSVAPSEMPEIIIPKLNVQIPVVYGEKSIDESDIQNALEKGVIHYPTTVTPGQQGNAAFFGHSSNNIFNKGKYKFAFVLLRQLVPGDIFYLTYDKKVYSYRVFDKKIIAPSEVGVLGGVAGKPVTASLITCDPPGTSTNRLVVWGEQISPDPAGAAATPAPAPAIPTTTTPSELPSEGPTLWKRMWNSIF